MARKIHRLALLLLLALLPAPLRVEAIYLRPEEFIPHINDVTWHSAQTHCREIHHDLITIGDQAENQDIFALGGWIGLYLEGSQWKWSRRGERANYTIWKSGEPSVGDDCAYKLAYEEEWRADPCSQRHMFICFYETLVIVRQEKTWVEALQHCRSLEAIDPSLPATVNKNHRYDLMSLLTSDHHVYAREKAKHATTDEVWTGLYFLAGQWMWVGGAVVQYTSLPQCAATNLCGTVGKSGTQSYQRGNCGLRKNFLCYRREP